MKLKEINNLRRKALIHHSNYHNLRPTKPMEVDTLDILWLISEIEKLRKEKKTNVKLLRTLASEEGKR